MRNPRTPQEFLESIRVALSSARASKKRDLRTKDQKIDFIHETLANVEYDHLSRSDKGLVRQYVQRESGYSRAQVARVIASFRSQPESDEKPVTVAAVETLPQQTSMLTELGMIAHANVRTVKSMKRRYWVVGIMCMLCVALLSYANRPTASLVFLTGEREPVSSWQTALKIGTPGAIVQTPTDTLYTVVSKTAASSPTIDMRRIDRLEKLFGKAQEVRRLTEIKEPQAPQSVLVASLKGLLGLPAGGKEGQVLIYTNGKASWKYLPNVTKLDGSGTANPARSSGSEVPSRRGGGGSGGGGGGSSTTTIIQNITSGSTGPFSINDDTTGVLRIDRGGTGFGSFATGDLLVGSGTTLVKLSMGANGTVLSATGGTLRWVTSSTVAAPGWTDDGAFVRLSTAGDSVGIGTSTPKTKLEVLGTLSGSSVFATASLLSSGSLTVNGAVKLKSLTSCAILQTDSNGALSCGSMSASVSTGALAVAFDRRYVNTSGDTMTGGLLIQNGGTPGTIDAGLLLEIAGAASGRILHAQDQLRSSGSLIVRGASRLQGSVFLSALPNCLSLQSDSNGALSCNNAQYLATSTGSLKTYFDQQYLRTSTGSLRALFDSLYFRSSTGSLQTYFDSLYFRSSTGSLKTFFDTQYLRTSTGSLKTFFDAQYLRTSTGSLKTFFDSLYFRSSTGSLKNYFDTLYFRSSTGALQTGFDRRYVNTSGDTMTGGLLIQNGGTPRTIDAGLLLEIVGTASGRIFHAQDMLRSSGSLIVRGASVLQSTLFVSGITTLSSDLTVGGNVGIGTSSPKTKLETVGTVSGTTLVVSNLANCNTNNTVKANALGQLFCATDEGGGGSSSKWTDNGAITYLTQTSDDVAIGGSDATAPFYFSVPQQTLKVPTFSGSTLFGNVRLATSGSLVVNSSVIFKSLASCATLQTNSNGALSCGGAGLATSTGALQTAFDKRFVNAAGDTMTGGLLIQSGTLHGTLPTIDAGVLLEVEGTMSGRTLFIADKLMSSGALVVRGANNTAPVLYTDLANGRVGIGTNAPVSALDIRGGLTLSGSTFATYISPNGSPIATKINIPNFNPGAFGQMLAMGIPSSAPDTARVMVLNDARTSLHQPSILVASPDENQGIGFSFDGSNTLGLIKSSVDMGFAVGAFGAPTTAMVINTTGNVGIGTSSAETKLEVIGTASGRILHAQDQLRSSGSLLIEGATVLQGSVTLSSLTNCQVLQSDSNGALSCGTIAASSTFGTGNVLTIGNRNYVNASGDTMTGGLLIQSGTLHGTLPTIDTGLLLEVAGTASGRILHAQDQLRSSGTLLVEGASVLQGTVTFTSLTNCNTLQTSSNGALSCNNAQYLATSTGSLQTAFDRRFVNTSGDTMSGGLLIVSGGNGTLPSIDAGLLLEIAGTASGRHLHAQNLLTSSGGLKVAGHAAIGSQSAINDASLLYTGYNFKNTLSLQETFTDLSGDYINGITNYVRVNPSTAPNAWVYGTDTEVEIAKGNAEDFGVLEGSFASATNRGIGVLDYLAGGESLAFNAAGGGVTDAMGLYTFAQNSSGGTITNAYGLRTYSAYNTGDGTISTGYGLRIESPVNAGTVVNNYGISIADQSSVGVANSYNLYSDGATAKNYFAGLVGIGKLGTPNTKLEVVGSMSGSSLTVSSLSNCQAIQTSSAGALSCGTDRVGASTGSLVTAFDRRYVNTSGDTMTGGLLIQNGGTPGTIDTGLLLEVVGTASGRILHAQDQLRSSGSLLIEGASVLQGAVTFSSLTNCQILQTNSNGALSCGTVAAATNFGTGNVLTIGDARYVNTSGDTMTGGLLIQSGTLHGTLPSIDAGVLLEVAGTMSGRTLRISDKLMSSGALVIRGASNAQPVLYTDLTNGRVGIGTATPKTTLDVVGDISASGAIRDAIGWIQNQGGVERLKFGNNNGSFGGGATAGSVMSGSQFSFFDTTTVNSNAKGFWGSVFDGRYIYLVPYSVGAGANGQITRYDTTKPLTSASSYTVFDTTAVDTNSKGFQGAVFDGRYVYFVPFDNGAKSGQVTRYDTLASFTSTSSYAVFDTTAVNANSKGFAGGIYDGRYVYFIPQDRGVGTYFGQITRYDTSKPFTSASAYAVFDTTGVDANSKGFQGAVFDGRYLYLVPYYTGSYSGQITRYDTSLSFTSASAYSVFDATAVNANAKGFFGAVYDGRYVYFVPNYNGTDYSGLVTRYDTTGGFTSTSSYSVFDTTTVNSGAKGFQGAVYDGRYVYFVPNYDGVDYSGLVVRYDSTQSFTSASAYSTVNATSFNANAKGFVGGIFDGHYVYMVPYNNGSQHGTFLRMQGWAGGADSASTATKLARTSELYILSNGNVGIGTITPGSKLSVSGALLVGNNIGSASADAGTALEILGTASGKSLRFSTGYFTATGAAMVPLTVQEATSQTANMTEWKASDGTVFLAVPGTNGTNEGALVFYNAGTAAARLRYHGGYMDFVNAGQSAVYPVRMGGLGINVAPDGASGLLAIGSNTTDTTAIFRAINSQTGNLTQWQNTSGIVLASVDVNGNFEIAAMASGRTLHAQDVLRSSGTLLVEGATTLQGSVTFTSLTNCQALQTSSAGALSCATIAGSVSTGSLVTAFDKRYVNTSGDTMSGGLLIVNGGNGTLPTIDTGLLLEIAGTASGRILHAQDQLRSSGTLLVEGASVLQGTVTFTSLTNCNTLQTSSNGALSCNNAQYLATSTGSLKTYFDSLYFRSSTGSLKTYFDGFYFRTSTGALQTGFDKRYVNTSGDTMTGGLLIQSGTLHGTLPTIDAGVLLEVAGTMSGRVLTISDRINSSGALVIKKYAGTSTGNLLVVDTKGLVYDATNKRIGIGTSTPVSALEVNGTIENGLVGWWPMDEGVGTYFADKSINAVSNSSGAFVVSNGWTTGKFGKGTQFNGSNYAVIKHSTALSPSVMTVSFWLKTNSLASDKLILSKGKAAASRSYWFYENSGIQFGMGAIVSSQIAPSMVTDNNWHHIVGTYDGTNLNIYLDGNVVGTPVAAPFVASTGDIGIGAYSDGSFFSNAKKLDDLRIYSRVLSNREIADLYRNNPLGIGGTINTTLNIESGASLKVSGTISGAALNVMGGNSYMLGNLMLGSSATAETTLEIAGSASGRILHAQDQLRSSGTLLVEGATVLQSTITFSSLTNCTSLQTSSAGALSCNNAQYLSTSTGALQIAFDRRYVNTSGDTMSGGLLIVSGGNGTLPSIDAGLLLEIAGTASGRILHAQDALRSSGTLIVRGNATFDVNTLFVDASNNRVGILTAAPKTTLEVRGTISGSLLTQNGPGTNYFLGNVSVGSTSSVGQFFVAPKLPTATLGTLSTTSAVASVAIQGRYVYATRATVLQVIDVKDPSNPAIIASLTMGTAMSEIAVQGNYAYIVDNGDGLHIVDISKPNAPKKVATLASATGLDLIVQGRYAYISVINTLKIVDIANPAAPVQLGSTVTNINSPSDLTVRGNYAYIANFAGNNVLVFDVSNPTNPVNVGSVALNQSNQITSQGNYLYASSGGYLAVLDASNPLAPSVVGSVRLRAAGYFGGQFIVQGRYVYVTDDSSNLFYIVDVSTPSAPTNLGSLAFGSQMNAMAIQGRYAYVASPGSNVFYTLDLGGSYQQNIEAGLMEVGGLSVMNYLSAYDGDFKGGLQVGKGIDVHGQSAIVSTSTGSANYALSITSRSGGLLIATRGTKDAPHIRFGTGGIYDAALWRSAANVLTTNASFYSQGTLSGAALTITGLKSCASLQTDSAGALSCGSALSQTNADSRYVNTSGDTMTGGLLIQNTTTHGTLPTIDAGVLLEVAGTASGRSLRFNSGFFTATGATMVPLTVREAVSHTGNLTEWQASDGTVLLSVPALGSGNEGALEFYTGGIAQARLRYHSGYMDFVNAGQSALYPVRMGGLGINVAPDGASGLLTIGKNTTDTTAIFRAITSQTGNLTEWQNTSSTALTVVNTSGYLGIGTSSPTTPLHIPAKVPTATLANVDTTSALRGVAVQGRYVYAPRNTVFDVIDVNDPSNPVVLSTLTMGTAMREVAVQGNYAYIVDLTDGLHVVDISKPKFPKKVATLAAATGDNIFVQGRYVYIITPSNSLRTIDIANPAAPVLVSNVGTSLNGPVDFTVQGNYAYVSNYSASMISVFDISSPSNPSNISSLALNKSRQITTNGKYIYASSGGYVTVIDGSNPLSLSIVGSVKLATTDFDGQFIVQGRYVYVTDNTNGKFYIVDATTPSAPTSLGSLSFGSQMEKMAIQGRYAYVSSPGNGFLYTLDLGGSYQQNIEAGLIEVGGLSVLNYLSAYNGDFRGGLQVGKGIVVHGQSAISNTGTGSSAYALSITSRSGGLLIATRGTQDAPHIRFGTGGVYDVSLFRPAAGLLATDATLGVGTGAGLIGKTTIYTDDAFNNPALFIRSKETTAGQDLVRIISDVTSTGNKVFRIQADGSTFSDNAYTSTGADYAEWFYSDDTDLVPGEAVCIDVSKPNSVKRCTRDGDANIMGIVSTNPAFIGNGRGGVIDAAGLPLPGYVLVGLIGQVPARAMVESNSGSAIRPGDQVTAASIPGFVRKANPGDSTVGVALEGLSSGQGVINVLISRRNQSMTVEAVEQKVLDSIRDMQIEDEVNLMVSDALQHLNVSDDIRTQIQTQLTALSLDQQINSIVDAKLSQRLGTGASVSSQSSAGTTQQTQFSSTGSLHAGEIYGSTLSAEDTLQVGGDARIGGDLHVEGTLHLSNLFIGGLLHLDGGLEVAGEMKTDTLTVESGSVLKGPVQILQSASVEQGARLSFSSGSTLFAATGSTVDLSELIVRNALTVLGDITIQGLATFLGDVEIQGQLTVSARQAGFAVIPQTGTSVTIPFDPPFSTLPAINATPNGRVGSEWWISASSATGFTIQIDKAASSDVKFSWFAVGVRDAETVAGSSSSVSSAPSGIPFPVDALGVPVSSNDVWNACIRNQTVLDENGQPLSCARYHNDHEWEQPDLHITFSWNTGVTPPMLILPEGYTAVMQQEASSSSSVASSSSSSSTISSSSSSAASSEASSESSSSSNVISSLSSSEASSEASSSSVAFSSSSQSSEVQEVVPSFTPVQ